MRAPRPTLARMLRAQPVAAERRAADESRAREALYGRASTTRRHADLLARARRAG